MFKKTIISGLLLTAAHYAMASQSLMETYEQAVAADPTLAIANLNARNDQENVKSGLSAVLPDVTLGAQYGIGSDPAEESILPNPEQQSIGASVSVSQNLFALAALSAYDALKVNAQVSEIAAEYAQQELIIRVAEGYISALRAKDALDVLNAQLEAVERQFQQTEQRYEVGLVTITDVLDATATLDETKVALIRAESNYDIALQNLSIITSETPDGVMSIRDDLPIDVPAESGQQQWVDFAVKNHPEIIAAQKGLEVGELTLKARRQENLPTVAGTASINYNDRFGNDATDNDFETNWSARVGISISYSLYDGGASAATVAKQGISNNITEQNIELLRRGKAVTVANLYRTVRADAQNIEAQQQALKSRESALQATTVGYDVGTRNIVEVLDAQLSVFSAQNNLNNARYDYILNLLNLKKEAGQATVADLERIEAFLVE